MVSRSGGGRRSGWVAAASAWVLLAALYLLLVTGTTWPEFVAAASVAGLGVGLARHVLRAAELPFELPRPALWRLPTVTRIAARETRAFLRAFVQLLRGRQPRSRFVAPAVEDLGAGEDASVTIEVSVAPNTYVVALLRGQEALLVHQLEASDATRSSFPRWGP